MKNRNLKVGDQLKLTRTRYWGGGNKQVVTSIIEITKLFDKRCEYKTVQILNKSNVNPIVKNLLDVKGGFSFNIFEAKLPSYLLEELA